MTTGPWFSRLFSPKRLILISLFLAWSAKAQWGGDGPPNVVEQQFITTGGITYFRLVGLLSGGSCCQRIAGYDVSRQGSALNQIIQQEGWFGLCELTFCDPWREELVSVLGPLPAGSYNLTLSAVMFGGSSPWAFLSFNVPADSGPTLRVSAATTNGSPLLFIDVAGVSNVVYVLESSTNLINWAALRTNLGGPVTFSEPMTNGSQRFYRAASRQAPSHRL